MTLYISNRDGNGKTSEEGHYKLPLSMLKGNVLDSDDLLVTQQATLTMGVAIAPGIYRIPDTSGNYSYSGWSSAIENVAISTSDPANPRISTVVIYVDKSATTSAVPPNNPNIAKIKVVNGAATSVPVASTATEIQASVGTGNPYIVLATVRVNAAVTTISNTNITDARVRVGILDDILSASNLTGIVGNLMYPIGSIYTNMTNSVNPATLLGFGTWTSLEGRVIVGKTTAAGTFFTAGSTGGEESHVLSVAELAAHQHANRWGIYFPSGTGSLALNDRGGDGLMVTDAAVSGEYMAANTPAGNSTGSNTAHNNLQPYIVGYIWQRTA